MAGAVMYCTHTCGYCRMAMQLLDKKGADYDKIFVDEFPERRQEMMQKAGQTTVPQIFINGHHIGGYTDLVELDIEGELEDLLQN